MMLIHTLNQVAEDNQLLNTARDYFRFTTGFFEIINVSATHIYHSALELSPLSSIIRKLYYSQRPCPSPRVVLGVPDSWDDSIASISTEHSNDISTISTKQSNYKSSNWSPCGNFVAVVTGGNVEIRGALALNLLFTLQSTTNIRHKDGLSYSPNGHSLACCSDTAIIIWDTQTGGVIRQIDYEVDGNGWELVWSLDGDMISILSPLKSSWLTVHVYEVTSGTMRSSGTAKSRGRGSLWAHEKSFRIMTTTETPEDSMIEIYEVGCTSALTKVEQFHFQSRHRFRTFFPGAYRIAIFAFQNPNQSPEGHRQAELLILNVQNSEVLLRESGAHDHVTFSPDGNFIAAFIEGQIPIWRHTSGHYTRWRKLQLASLHKLQFSTTSSILCHSGPLLHVLHLDHSPAAPTTEPGTIIHAAPCDTFPPHGAYIVTGHQGESVITITNISSQNPSPPQFIDTGLGILAMVLTGNILLVRDSGTIVAWLLTEEGVVDGTFGEKRADRSNSLWDVSSKSRPPPGPIRVIKQESDGDDDLFDLLVSVKGKIAFIGFNEGPLCLYCIKTGEILDLNTAYQGIWYGFTKSGANLYCHDAHKWRKPLKHGWPVSETTLAEGWVKDPEGKHRLWLHPRWRSMTFYDVHWFDQVTALRLRISSELVVVKF